MTGRCTIVLRGVQLARVAAVAFFAASPLAALGQPASGSAAAPAKTGAAAAKPSTGAAGAGQDKTPSVKVERDASGQKVYRITDAVVIEGKVQKPNAFYVLQRSSINYDWAELKEDFVPKIVDAVRRHPF
jgi:hypothetical protein